MLDFDDNLYLARNLLRLELFPLSPFPRVLLLTGKDCNIDLIINSRYSYILFIPAARVKSFIKKEWRKSYSSGVGIIRSKLEE